MPSYGVARHPPKGIIMDKTEKELDRFVGMVLAYAKKHKLSYVIAVGKKIGDHVAVMDSWWEPSEGYLEPMTRCFLKGEGAIPIAMKWGILHEAEEFNKKNPIN